MRLVWEFTTDRPHEKLGPVSKGYALRVLTGSVYQ
jgi:hypothetical protein